MSVFVDLFASFVEGFREALEGESTRTFRTRDSFVWITDEEFPTEKTAREKDDILENDKWLIHIAKKDQWKAMMGEYAPIIDSGSKSNEVRFFDMQRLGNHIRAEVFTKAIVSHERGVMFDAETLDNKPSPQVLSDEFVMVYVPVETKGIVFDQMGYPKLSRPLDKEKDAWVVSDLVFDVEQLSPAIEEDWQIEEQFANQRRQREKLRRQDEF